MSIATFPILFPVVRVTALSALCLAAALILGPTDHALAGPNAGGTLIVHDTCLAFTNESGSYPSPPPTIDPLTVDNNVPPGIPAGGLGWVWKVYAAFPGGSWPRLKGLAFRSVFSAHTYIVAAGLPDPEADHEIPRDGWPAVSGGSDAVLFGVTQTDRVDEVYWFAGYGYYAGGTWSTAGDANPLNRFFVDDAVPPNQDAIAGYSSIGFGVEGHTELPLEIGACCVCPDICSVVPPAVCAAMGGTYLGNGAGCDPAPCAYPPYGACCVNYVCTIEFPDQCSQMGGTFYGQCVDCDPTPCPPPTPLGVTSWGRIKCRYQAE